MTEFKKINQDLNYTIVLQKMSAFTVNFVIYKNFGLDTNNIMFYENKLDELTSNLDEVLPFIKGEVRFDGCSNFEFRDQETMIHCCSREDLVNIGLILGECHDFAMEVFKS